MSGREIEEAARQYLLPSKKSSIDLISTLPEPILHHCLSFLPTKYAIRTSVLSTKWKSIWDSFPILDFDQEEFEKSPSAVALNRYNRVEMFLDYLYASIERREHRYIQKFRLVLGFHTNPFDFRVVRALKFAAEVDVRDFELINHTCQFFNLPCSFHKAKFLSSIKLMYLKVDIDELMKGCPRIEELRIQYCRIPPEIKIVSNKLKTFEIGYCPNFRSLTVEGINLESLTFSGFRLIPCCLNISACTFLKHLSLSKTLIKYQWLEDVISTLVLLETLHLDYCKGLNRVRVRHQRLRGFKLYVLDHEDVSDVEIECPKLRWFGYHGKPKRFSSFSSSGNLDAALSLYNPDNILATHWFPNLIQFLQLFGHSKKLKLKCVRQEYLIVTEESRDKLLPPLLDLKNLSIEISDVNLRDDAELVDALFWLSPHLERLSIVWGGGLVYLKFQRKSEKTFCCEGYPPQCLKHFLQKVRGLEDEEKTRRHSNRLMKNNLLNSSKETFSEN